MILLVLAVIVLAILALVLVDAAVAQRQRERWLSARIAMLRRQANAPVVYVSPPANDVLPLIAARVRRPASLALRTGLALRR